MLEIYELQSIVLSTFLWSVKPDLPAFVCDLAKSARVRLEALSQHSLCQPIDVPCHVQCDEDSSSINH